MAAVIPCMFSLVWIGLAVLMLASWWKIFVKAGKPGWAGIIPIYNLIVLLEILNKPIWWIVLFFVCFPIAWIVIALELAKAFGKSTGFAVGLILLGFIFIPILGFGSAQFKGGAAQPPVQQ